MGHRQVLRTEMQGYDGERRVAGRRKASEIKKDWAEGYEGTKASEDPTNSL